MREIDVKVIVHREVSEHPPQSSVAAVSVPAEALPERVDPVIRGPRGVGLKSEEKKGVKRETSERVSE